MIEALGDCAMDDERPTVPVFTSVQDRLQQLSAQAQTSDEDARRELQDLLDEHPEIWKEAGDLAAFAQSSWLRLIAGHNELFGDSLRRKAEEFRRELAGPQPGVLERLLVERVVACWLPLHYYEALAAQPGELPVRQAKFVQERLNLAQRRYIAAVKALATVRRLAVNLPHSSSGVTARKEPHRISVGKEAVLPLSKPTKRARRAAGG